MVFIPGWIAAAQGANRIKASLPGTPTAMSGGIGPTMKKRATHWSGPFAGS